ncbi:MAG: MFS transporter [Bacteroidales bacterium]|nr:MFS transporter [Bacteroidales bacterium]
MKSKPDLGFWKLWNLSFGFFGVQIAYALQSAQVSRIFSTIGADPHSLSYFWILPPLMGLIVQPIIGTLSDKTWNRFGRRLPYLLIGASVAIIVMCFLPNAGSLGLSVSAAILFGLIMLMFLDTSINMAMQPFKMLVGDFVNEKQKGLAYSIQSFLCNAGSLVGYVAPIILALFLSNTAPEGEVPPTVIWSFYLGAIILVLCVIYTFAKVKEMPPKVYAEYHGLEQKMEPSPEDKKEGIIKILAKAPKVFWTVGLVQFFCWSAFLYMWTYSTDAIAGRAFHTPAVDIVDAITVNGQTYHEKNLFQGQMPIVLNGQIQEENISKVEANTPLTIAHSATEHAGTWNFVQSQEVQGTAWEGITLHNTTVLNAASAQYQEAGNWYGVLLAIQAIAALVWALVLAKFSNRRMGYSVSLLIGAAGFISTYFFTNPWLLSISYALVGCAWAAMLAMPFTILTNALGGNHIGTYLGLFNCTICIPQIIAAVCGGAILSIFPLAANGTYQTVWMLVVAGVLLAIGACAVWNVKETYGSQSK